jgi:hypothetical protein
MWANNRFKMKVISIFTKFFRKLLEKEVSGIVLHIYIIITEQVVAKHFVFFCKTLRKITTSNS